MAEDIKRDRWGRPLIVSPDTGREVAYTRISTVAHTLDDGRGLVGWKIRKVLEGAKVNPALHESFLAAGYRDQDKLTDDLIAAAGGNAKREYGSAMHEAVHAINAGQDGLVPEFLGNDIAAYRAAVSPLQFVEMEAFGACHQYALAGSWDAKVRCPDGKIRVADLKTGTYYPQACRIQLAAYALCTNYPDDASTVEVEQDYGLVINLPGDGTCTLFKSDLALGRDELAFALELREHQKFTRSERLDVLSFERQEGWLHALIAGASTREELRTLWGNHKSVWGAEETGLANARLLVIGGEAA